MPDVTVDSILLEIEAPADKAKAGLDKIKNSLNAMKSATTGLDVSKLNQFRDFVNSITVSKDTGDSIKNMGAGLRSLTKSVNSLSQIDSAKLNEVADVISKIGASLGQLGTNNKINIRIDSEGIKKAVQPLQEVKDTMKKNVLEPYEQFQSRIAGMGQNFTFNGTGIALSKEIEKAETRLDSLLAKEERMQMLGKADVNSSAYRALQMDITEVCNKLDILYAKQEQEKSASISESAALNQLGTSASTAGNELLGLASAQKNFNNALNDKNGASTATSRMQELINQIGEFKKTISGMESGKQLFNADQYKDAVNGLAQAQHEFNVFKNSISETPKTMADVASSIRDIGNAAGKCGLDTFSSVLGNISKLLPMIQIGGVEASAGFQSMAVGLEAIQTAIPIIGIILTLITALVNGVRKFLSDVQAAAEKAGAMISSGINKIKGAFISLKSWLSSMLDGIKSKIDALMSGVKSKVDALASGIKSKISSLFSSISQKFKSGDKSLSSFLDKLSSKLQKVMRLFTFMGLRKMMTAIYKEVGNMVELLAKFSDSIGSSFNTNMSNLVADFKWLAGSLVAAFEPILSIVLPILDALISKLVEAINAINQFFAALSGAAVWTKATKHVENYAKSLEKAGGAAKKANKELKNTIASFDELHVLNDNSNKNSGAGAANPADYFETENVEQKYKDFLEKLKEMWKKADFTELGKEIGDKLAAMLANIQWGKIRANARKLGKSLATLINGFIQGEFDGKKVSWWIGNTLAQAINTAFDFVNSFAKSLNWGELGKAVADFGHGLLDGVDWKLVLSTLKTVAAGLAEFINALTKDLKLWEKAGKAVANALNSIISAIQAFIDGLDFKQAGEAIGTALGSILTNIHWKDLFATLSKGIDGFFQILKGFTDTFPWTEFAIKFTDGINEGIRIINMKWGAIRDSVVSFFENFGKSVKTAIDNVKWGELGKAFAEGIGTILSGINAFLDQDVFSSLGKALNTLIKSALTTEIDGQSIGTLFGKTLANAINAGFEYMYQLIQGLGSTLAKSLTDFIKGALGNIDWPLIQNTIMSLGKEIADFFNTVFSDTSLWASVGEAIRNALNAVIEGARTFVENFNFADFGTAVGTGLGNALAGIHWESIFTTLAEGINGIFEAVKTFAESFPWSDVALRFAHGINNGMKSLDWTTIKEGFDAFAKGLGKNLNTMLKEIDWEEVGRTFGNLINTLFSGIGKFLAEIDFATLGDNLASAINTAVDTIDWESVGGTINTLISGVTTLVNKMIDKVDWKSLMGNITTLISKIDWNSLFETVFRVIGSVFEFKTIFKGVSFTIIGSELCQAIRNSISSAFDGFVDWAWDNTIGKLISWINEKLGVSGDATKDVEDAGKNIISGFLEGLATSWIPFPGGAFKNFVDFVAGIRDFFEINSPSKLFKGFGENIIDGFKNGIETFTKMKDTVTTWCKDVIEWFTKGKDNKNIVDHFKETANNIVQKFKDEVGSKYTQTKDNMSKWSTSVKEWFEKGNSKNIFDSFKETAGNIIQKFKDEVGSKYTQTKDNVSKWSSSVTEWFEKGNGKSLVDSFRETAGNVVQKFKDEIGSKYTTTKDNISRWASSILDWFKADVSIDKFSELARDVVDGFKNGIGKFYTSCRDSVEKWGSSIISWFKEKLDSNSPSKVFYRIGSDTVEGYNNAVEEVGKSTKDVVNDWADSFTDIDIGSKFNVDTSELQNYTTNFGEEFGNATIAHRLQRELNTNANLTADVDGSMVDAVERGVTRAMGGELYNLLNTVLDAHKQKYILNEISMDGVQLGTAISKAMDEEAWRYSPSTI